MNDAMLLHLALTFCAAHGKSTGRATAYVVLYNSDVVTQRASKPGLPGQAPTPPVFQGGSVRVT